ncbi:MAG: hypothetical protein R6V12_13920, partial [Candidatus Hydrogenedentota bacterium]
FDPDFIDFIKDLYIKSSFTDHLIMAMNYSLIYNTQTSLPRPLGWYAIAPSALWSGKRGAKNPTRSFGR